MGAARGSSHPHKDDFQVVEQHDHHQEHLQDPAPPGEPPYLALERSGGAGVPGSFLAGGSTTSTQSWAVPAEGAHVLSRIPKITPPPMIRRPKRDKEKGMG